MSRNYFITGITTICLLSTIVMYVLVIPVAGAQTVEEMIPTLIPTQASIPKKLYDNNSADYYSWYAMNTTSIMNTTYSNQDMYNGGIIYVGGGGGAAMAPTGNTTPDQTPNATADIQDLVNQVAQANEISTTIMKVVVILTGVGIIIGMLMQTGVIGGRRPNTVRYYGDEGAWDPPSQQPQRTVVQTATAEQADTKEEKKPEKRDRYEVIKV